VEERETGLSEERSGRRRGRGREREREIVLGGGKGERSNKQLGGRDAGSGPFGLIGGCEASIFEHAVGHERSFDLSVSLAVLFSPGSVFSISSILPPAKREFGDFRLEVEAGRRGWTKNGIERRD